MEHHQVYGLATPEDFVLPPHHPLWTEESYAAFHYSVEASEKYDTKVRATLHTHTTCNASSSLRPPQAKMTLVPYQNQTLHPAKYRSHRPNLDAPSPKNHREGVV